MSRTVAETTQSGSILLSANSGKTVGIDHISVCVPTYKRPVLLRRLLGELAQQETHRLFTFSIVVADNDGTESGRAVVEAFAAESKIPIKYVVEHRQNIAMARNKVVANANGDFIAFIDDDEFPAHDWLLTLLTTCRQRNVDGVLGPVLRHFDESPPRWLAKSRFYVRRVNATGASVDWHEARTGNVLFKRDIVANDAMPFRPEFRAGEDQDFFRRKIAEGRVFIWSSDAKVFETVPRARWRWQYMVKKALLRGATAALQPDCGVPQVVKSLVAIALYTLALPIAPVVGRHHFMALLVKTCDHLGKVLGKLGINPIRTEYVTE